MDDLLVLERGAVTLFATSYGPKPKGPFDWKEI